MVAKTAILIQVKIYINCIHWSMKTPQNWALLKIEAIQIIIITRKQSRKAQKR